MRLSLETNALYTSQAGVARYVRGLMKGLAQIGAPDVEWSELAWPVEGFSHRQPLRAAKTAYRELIWAHFCAPALMRRQKTDMVHATAAFHISTPPSIRQIVTLYDLAVLDHPERFRRWHRFSTRRQLRHLGRADGIICISRFTADRAGQLLGLPAAKLFPIHIGCDFHPDEPAPVEQRPDFDVPSEFFLFVGSLEPGKNLSLLRATYELAKKRGVILPPLMILGARWEGVGNEGSPPEDWHYLGRQPDSVLVYLYRRALALIFPSKYEGFGLPVVEAMALGCPVVCSPIASLPEVGGEAALYSEISPEGYLAAMLRLLGEPGLREDLIRKGRVQAGKFSWADCARKTVAVYRQLACA